MNKFLMCLGFCALYCIILYQRKMKVGPCIAPWKSQHIFSKINVEVWTPYNISPKLRTIWFLMLSHDSNIALQSTLSVSIPHDNSRIKASKLINFNKARKWLLIACCFEKSPFTNCNTWGEKLYSTLVCNHLCIEKLNRNSNRVYLGVTHMQVWKLTSIS